MCARLSYQATAGCSAARLARQLRELEVPGSNPGTPTQFQQKSVTKISHTLLLLSGLDKSVCPFLLVFEFNRTLFDATINAGKFSNDGRDGFDNFIT